MLRTAFILAIIGFGLLAAIRNRFAALLLYLWYAFFRPEDWIWIDLSAFRLSVVLGAVLTVPALFSGVYPNVTHPLSLGALGFLASGLVAQLGAVQPDIGWYSLEYLAKVLLVSLLTVSLVTTRERFLVVLWVIAGSLGFHAAKSGLMSLLAGGMRFTHGPGGAFIDNNAYAVGLAMVGPMLVCVAQNTTSKYVRWGCALAPPLVVLTVIGTYSRGGFLALMTAALVLLLFQPRRKSWLLLAGALVIPIWMFMTSQSGYLDRLSTIGTYEEVEERSALSRIHFWKVAALMAIDRPLGVGLFNSQFAYDEYDFLHGAYGTGRALHSSHMQALTETGLAGGACWAGLFGLSLVLCFRIRRRARLPGISAPDRQAFITGANALIASQAGFIVGGSFISMALNDLTWITFALVAALDRLSIVAVRAVTAQHVEAARPLHNPLLAPARRLSTATHQAGVR